MRLTALCVVAAMAALSSAGQPVERFRGADQFTFSQGSADARYGNADCSVKVQMEVFILGHQEFDSTSSTPETKIAKSTGSLDFKLKLSDFDPLLPPDEVPLTGSDMGNDLIRHTTDTVLAGPYVIQGNFNGVDVNLTLKNVHVTGTLDSQGSNSVTPPLLNPILAQFCDVQFDDVNNGAANFLTAVPGSVSGWIVSPIFTVRSMRVDVSGIQQAGQVPAKVIAPDSVTVVLGRLDSGDAGSLGSPEGNALRVCKFIVPNQQVAPITVEVTGTSATVPQNLSLWAVGRMAQSGAFSQTLDLYDYGGSGYSTGDSRTDVIGTSYVARKLDATGSVSRYLGNGGALRARYRIRQTGPSATLAWCSDHDLVAWTVTP